MISHLNISGEKIFFKKYNSGKKNVLLIHGLAIDSTIWEKIIPLLKKFQVICLDLPGYGLNADNPRNADLESQALFIDNFVKAYGQINSVIGYSFGGRVVYEYFKKYNPSVEHLIIIAAPFFNTLFMRINSVFLNYLSRNNYLASKAYFIGTTFPVFHFILKKWNVINLNNRELIKNIKVKLRAGNSYSKIIKNLASVSKKSKNNPVDTIATLDYIYGEKDGSATLKMIKERIKQDKSGRLIVLKNSYHLIPLEFPEKVVSIIKNIITVK